MFVHTYIGFEVKQSVKRTEVSETFTVRHICRTPRFSKVVKDLQDIRKRVFGLTMNVAINMSQTKRSPKWLQTI
jgi:hypothetical protein